MSISCVYILVIKCFCYNGIVSIQHCLYTLYVGDASFIIGYYITMAHGILFIDGKTPSNTVLRKNIVYIESLTITF